MRLEPPFHSLHLMLLWQLIGPRSSPSIVSSGRKENSTIASAACASGEGRDLDLRGVNMWGTWSVEAGGHVHRASSHSASQERGGLCSSPVHAARLHAGGSGGCV